MEKQVKIDLSNKNILITGAAGLLGSEFVGFLIKFNARCICLDKNFSLLKKKFSKYNSDKLLYFKCDITKTKDYFTDHYSGCCKRFMNINSNNSK